MSATQIPQYRDRNITGDTDQAARDIGCDIHYHLPNAIYLDFVNALLDPEGNSPTVDPFMVAIPAHKLTKARYGAYVDRVAVRKEIECQGSQIVAGRPGAGKTTMLTYLAHELSYPKSRTLVVPFPLAEILTTVEESELLEGRVSCLTPERLTHRIFDAFWRQIALKRKAMPAKMENVEDYLQVMRLGKDWMEKIRWFYHHYPPTEPGTGDDFELSAWLHADHSDYFAAHVRGEAALRRLVELITKPVFEEKQTKWMEKISISWPYDRIQVMIDGTERLSNLALKRLLQDTQTLEDLTLGYVDFKLFVDTACLDDVGTLECIRQGRVTLYEMPPWTTGELEQLLKQRMTTWMPEDTAGKFTNLDKLFDELFAEVPRASKALMPAARAHLVTTIAEGALRAYGEKTTVDAPIHALRLGRGILAACSGAWDTVRRPLRQQDCDYIIDCYWHVVIDNAT